MARTRPVTPLKRALFESGRTQKYVAQRVGISEATLSRIANGMHADDRTWLGIAHVLDVPVDTIRHPEREQAA